MNASEKPVFLYHADANPVGGHISHPVQQLLPPHGSSSLAQAGGRASGEIGAHRIDGVVSFKSARSEVYGSKKGADGPWVTTVTSVLEGFNVLDIIRADAIVAQLKVNHPHAGIHPYVSFGRTHFHNLTIEGKPVDPVFDFETYTRTEAHLMEHKGPWEKSPQHLGAAVAHTERLLHKETGAPAWVKKRYGWMLEEEQRNERGHVVCSLVKEVQGWDPKHTFGHILHVPDVGNLFFGELDSSNGLFRLTTLRIEMGCLADGELSGPAAASNGRGLPGSG